MILKHYFRGLVLTIPLILTLALASGCSHVPGMNKLLGGHSAGDVSQEEVEAFFVKGKTTQDEVRAKFGNPTSISEGKKGSTWVYSTAAQDMQAAKVATRATTAASIGTAMSGSTGGAQYAAAGAQVAAPMLTGPGASGNQTTLNVTFNRAKVVTDYSWSRTSQ